MARLRVVLIDDVREVREAFGHLLRNAGHEIVGEADDGASAVQATLAQRPDLVLMDWRMPGMDDVEATRQTRASYPSAAIVAFCSTDTPEVPRRFPREPMPSWTNKTSRGSSPLCSPSRRAA